MFSFYPSVRWHLPLHSQKSWGKLVKRWYLLFTCLGGWIEDKISLEVSEKEFARGATIAVFCRENHRHLLLLDELLSELIPVVGCVVHDAHRRLSPVGSILVKSFAKPVQHKSLWVSVGVHLAQRIKDRAVGVDGNHESNSWINCSRTDCVGDRALSPALTSEILLVDPSLINIDDALALAHKIDH